MTLPHAIHQTPNTQTLNLIEYVIFSLTSDLGEFILVGIALHRFLRAIADPIQKEEKSP